MSQFDYKEYYDRHRPHIHPPGATPFITFRLAGSIPKAVLRQYRAQKLWLDQESQRLVKENANSPSKAVEAHQARLAEFHRNWFRQFEDILHQEQDGPMWLREDKIGSLVANKLRQDDVEKYRLDAFCIMSNHVHTVFAPNLTETSLHEVMKPEGLRFVSDEPTLPQIMQSLKGVTARDANLALGRSGAFWETESYDHYVRDEAEFFRVVKYTLNNPVKAGLIKHWRDWPGNFLAEWLNDWAQSWKPS